MNSVNLDKYSDPFFLGETKEELRRIRQDFHVHPEIGLVTPRTSRIIADLLKDYGVDEKDFLDRLDDMVEQAFDDQCTGANPRYPLMSEIKEMYLKAYYGK